MLLPDFLATYIPDTNTRRFGEVLLSRRTTRDFQALHLRDRDVPIDQLNHLQSIPEVREMARYSPEGEYRPLKTAPSLKNGWVILESDAHSFYQMLDAIYPAAFAGTVKYFQGEIHPVSLRRTLGRQTGMYQFAKHVSDVDASLIMRETCAKGCLRQISWSISDNGPMNRVNPPNEREIPILCTEACTFVVSEARRLSREAYDRANPSKSAD
jgi:sirohydrochlorin cobaltochelatase